METLPQQKPRTYQLLALSSAINLMERAYKNAHEAQCPRHETTRSLLEQVGADLEEASLCVRKCATEIREEA